ncbi:MAG: Bax inhibitor-1/YccA family protein [Candidatus Paracaedibacteraceae bacterium]|nr:Bax inhibitor-1/YccA family protein [Candidatus Paracaedibacteraceae bacterium]
MARSDVFTSSSAKALQYREGLRAFMLRVYNYMAAALVFTGLISYGVSTSPELIQAVYGTPLFYVVIFAPLGISLFLGVRLERMAVSTAQTLFWTFAALIGLSLSSIFIVYTAESIVRVFFISAAMFAAASLYGYTTKQDLGPIGSFLFMGLVGIIIASFVNMFMKSDQLSWMISFIAVGVFAGLTAYDNQKLKQMYSDAWQRDQSEKTAIIGALNLYLNFINLFLHLLRFFGDRRN